MIRCLWYMPDREQRIIERGIIETKILNYMQESKMQYRSDKTKKISALDSFFNYSNLFNAIDMIKVEINYMCHYYKCFILSICTTKCCIFKFYTTKSFIISIHIFKFDAYNNINSFSNNM